jgi:YidC/Oxa1 family membrane protein insertase
MMDFQRMLAYSTLILSGFLLYHAWQNEQLQTKAMTSSHYSTNFVPKAAGNLPVNNNVPVAFTPTKKISHTLTKNPSKLITVTTDLLTLKINPRGGNVIYSGLLQYPETMKNKTPFTLFDYKTLEKTYLAETGLSGATGPDNQKEHALYKSRQPSYSLSDNQKVLNVELVWQNKKGFSVIKTYSFHRGSYKIEVHYTIKNNTKNEWTGNLFSQFVRSGIPPEDSGMSTFFGVALSSPDDHYQKFTFSKLKKADINQSVRAGWMAVVQHYFVSAWVPNRNQVFHYYSHVNEKVSGNDSIFLYTIGYIGPTISVPPSTSKTVSTTLYSGPTIASHLDQVAPNLKLTVDYGIFWIISSALFTLLVWLYALLGNWGWAIIGVTFIIKLIFYPLSAKSYRSMARMKSLQPKVQALKERFVDDQRALGVATMKLYREEKVNPLGGCLPIVVQIPVFIGLYWLLMESVQLRQAPFIFWIHDLAQKDPLYVLPLILGATMLLQQKMSPPPADPTQAKMMMLLPIVFTAIFINMPSGLVLYWVINNGLSILQQWTVMRKFAKNPHITRKKK